jgi:Ca2+:H+ antiporter
MKKIYSLMLFVPMAAMAVLTHQSEGTVFFLCAMAIVPMAFLLGEATENLAERCGPGVGGFVNATFGNATELIIGIFGILKGGEALLVVKASITGAILGNLLLIVGLSMFVGGWGRDKQVFSEAAVGTNQSMMILAVAGLMLPSSMHLLELIGANKGHGKAFTSELELHFSLWVAGILMLSYLLSLVFAFVTHSHIFKGPEHADSGPEDDVWPIKKAAAVLIGATLVIAALSESLIHTVESAGHALGLSPLFMGLVVVATVGNAAEHSSAVMVARKGKMDLALQIALGSAAQIALFVAPFLVMISWFLGSSFNLVFSPLEVLSVSLAVAIAAQVTIDGETNWFEGFQLISLYGMISGAFYYLT